MELKTRCSALEIGQTQLYVSICITWPPSVPREIRRPIVPYKWASDLELLLEMVRTERHWISEFINVDLSRRSTEIPFPISDRCRA